MTIQNVQLKSINGSNYQLLSIEPPLLQGSIIPNLTELGDVSITNPVNNQVLTWNSTLNKFVLSNASGSSTFVLNVNGQSSTALNFGSGLVTQTLMGTSSINLDIGLDNLNDVSISNPITNQVLTYNGSQWVNSGSNSSPSGITINTTSGINTLNFSNKFSVMSGSNTSTIDVNYPQTLDELTDLVFTNLMPRESLVYDGTNWVNQQFRIGQVYFGGYFPNTTVTNKNVYYGSGIVLQSAPPQDEGYSISWSGMFITENPISIRDGFATRIKLPFEIGLTNALPSQEQVTNEETAVLKFKDASQPFTRNQSTIRTSNVTALPSVNEFINSTGGSFTINLNLIPVDGIASFTDVGNALETNPVTLDGGSSIFAETGNQTYVLNRNGLTYEFIKRGNILYNYHRIPLISNSSGITGIDLQDEGINVISSCKTLNFVGNDVKLTFSTNSWSPADIQNQVLFWISADSSIPVNDLSNNSRTPSNTLDQPTVLSNALNGKPIFRFNSTQGLAYSNPYDPFNATVFAVVRDDNSDQRIINISGTNNLNARSLFDINPVRYALHNTGTTRTSYTAPSVSNNVWNMLEFQGSSNTLFNNAFALPTGTSTSTSPAPDSLINSQISINAVSYFSGAFQAVSSGTSNDIAEIVVVNNTISGANEDLVWGYLAHKYGLTANLPTNHPYKTVAPPSGIPKANIRIGQQQNPILSNNFTAIANQVYRINTLSNPVTATLDASSNWVVGDKVTFLDESGTNTSTGFGFNPLTILANSGQTIVGNASLVVNTGLKTIVLQFSDSGRFNLLQS